VKRVSAGNKSPSDPEVLDGIVRVLFPEGQTLTSPSSIASGEICPVMEQEVLGIARILHNRKAPGPDVIPNMAIKLLLALHPKTIADLLNKCLRESTFPSRWKRQKLLLLPKPGKPAGEPSSYRPICLLDTIGKVFEKAIASRLEAVIERAGGLATNQLEKDAGALQHPRLSAANTMYNGVLNLPLPPNTSIVGFADDVALVVTKKVLAAAEAAGNNAILTVEAWLAVAGLQLASHKTEAVLISSRKRIETVEIRVGGLPITSQRAIRYLGVLLDTRLSFRERM
ncbi:hypothetical protein KR032_004136, partial [Drosophila birchii]